MLIVITHPNPLQGEAALLSQLLGAGLEVLHWRKPEASREDTREALQALAPEHYARIALHHYHDLAADFNIRRLHFTEAHRRQYDRQYLEDLKGFGYTLSTSVHTMQDYAALPPLFDYCFFGPVFNSLSKEGYLSALSPGFRLPAQRHVPIVALGGVEEQSLASVKAMRFDGAAVLGALWLQPEQALITFKRLQEQWQISDPSH